MTAVKDSMVFKGFPKLGAPLSKTFAFYVRYLLPDLLALVYLDSKHPNQ